jgi:hypothetical protein
MRYTIRTATDWTGEILAGFDRYSVAVRCLSTLADSYDVPVELWDERKGDIMARYTAGRVHYCEGAPQVG